MASHVLFSRSGLCLPQVGTPQAQTSQAFQEVSGLFPALDPRFLSSSL